MMLSRRLLGISLVAFLLAGCTQTNEARQVLQNADPEQGRVDIKNYSCGVCHVIPGVRGARGQVGPTLEAYARRVYIAGKFPNDPLLLTQWIRDAPALAPRTAMPAIAMDEQQARNMAAYLYTLE